MNNSWQLLVLIGVLFVACRESENELPETKSEPTSREIVLVSSNKKVQEAFDWAKAKALSFVLTGKKGPVDISEQNSESVEVDYIPSYWAGYPGRSAFYSRDFCHQAIGAHLLSLQKENFSMLKAFAASAKSSRKGYPLWAMNFDGSPFKLDYRNDDDFVREVPAVFELVEMAYELYLWSGDKRYLEDDVLWAFCAKAVTDFVQLHDTAIPNGVAEGTGKGIFDGAASYNEQRDHPLIEAGDAIASQFKAFDAFSKMAQLRGETEVFEEFKKKTEDLKSYFNTDWGIKNTDTYNRGYLKNGKEIGGWGKENSWFLPMKGLTEPGTERTKKYLDFINERLDSKDDIPDNIEAISYIPEVFFLHHRNELGWKWMKHIIDNLKQGHTTEGLTGRNGDYPEVSYVLIRNVIKDLLGVVPNAEQNFVTTLSHLPTEIEDLKANNIPIGRSWISVGHVGEHTSELRHDLGKQTMKWKASFIGNHENLYVNGVKRESITGYHNGRSCSWVITEVNPGESTTVSINP